MLGRTIDAVGEKKVIMFESLALLGISLIYGFSDEIFSAVLALYMVFACYVGDQLLFAVNMARVTYLNRIVEVKEDLTPALAMGITLEHLVSMTVLPVCVFDCRGNRPDKFCSCIEDFCAGNRIIL
jgi:hypothetical protein